MVKKRHQRKLTQDTANPRNPSSHLAQGYITGLKRSQTEWRKGEREPITTIFSIDEIVENYDEKKNMKLTFPWNTMRRKNSCKSQIASYRHYVYKHKESVSNAIVLKPLA